MADIDFLPTSYRQMTVHRKANVWRLLAGGLFVAMIGVSAVYQHILRAQVLRTLASTNSQYDRAEALVARQRELKQQLRLADDEAELLVYLRHPWPTTRVLAAALTPLPDCVTLHEIHLCNGEMAPVSTIAPKPATATKTADAEPTSKRDLEAISQEYDGRPRLLVLDGVTTNTALLQGYVLALGRSSLFAKAELISLQADSAGPSTVTRFTARLIVRAGYGQPDGPHLDKSESHGAKPSGASSDTAVAAAPKPSP